MDWKAEIIALTELPEARAAKRDATFFPALREEEIAGWEESSGVALPDELRSFYLQSNGMEAEKGGLRPIWGLAEVRPSEGDGLLFGGWTGAACLVTSDGEIFREDGELLAADLFSFLRCVFSSAL